MKLIYLPPPRILGSCSAYAHEWQRSSYLGLIFDSSIIFLKSSLACIILFFFSLRSSSARVFTYWSNTYRNITKHKNLHHISSRQGRRKIPLLSFSLGPFLPPQNQHRQGRKNGYKCSVLECVNYSNILNSNTLSVCSGNRNSSLHVHVNILLGHVFKQADTSCVFEFSVCVHPFKASWVRTCLRINEVFGIFKLFFITIIFSTALIITPVVWQDTEDSDHFIQVLGSFCMHTTLTALKCLSRNSRTINSLLFGFCNFMTNPNHNKNPLQHWLLRKACMEKKIIDRGFR